MTEQQPTYDIRRNFRELVKSLTQFFLKRLHPIKMVKSFPSFQFDLLRKIMFYQLTLNFVQNLEDSLTSQCPNTSLSLAQQPSLPYAASHSFNFLTWSKSLS